MKRLVTLFLTLLLGLAGVAAGLGWWGQQRASALMQHPAFSAGQVPSLVAQQRQQLSAQVNVLLDWHPNLKSVPREYLEQPLEQTQELLFTLAQKALASRDRQRWQTLVAILNGIWLNECARERPEAEQLATLLRYKQRLQGLYAQARIFKVSAALPKTDGWHSSPQLAQRYLLGVRQQLWKQAHLEHPLQPLTWWHLQSDLKQLDRWHRQIQASRTPEEATSPRLKSARLGLRILSAL